MVTAAHSAGTAPTPRSLSLMDTTTGAPQQQLARPAVVMAIGTILSRITGLGRIVAMAFALGVVESRLADTYNIANTLPNVVYELVLGGVLSAVFIPVVVEQIKSARSRDEAAASVSALVGTALALLGIVAVAASVAAPWIMHLFTFRVPGAEGAAQQELATFFFRFFASQILLYGYSSIADGLLNAHDRFAVPMFAPIVNNLVVIATFVAYGLWFESSTAGVWVLAIGTTTGVAAMAAVHWPFVRALPIRLRFVVDVRHPAVKKIVRLSGWAFGYVVVNQIGFAVSLVLANEVQGGPTSYWVAFAFFQLPYGVVAVSIMTALVPTLARLALARDWPTFAVRTSRGLRATAVLLVPVTAGMVALALPGIEVLLQRGVFSASSSELVASVLQMFALGIVPFSAWLLFLRAFYAMQDARTPFLLNLLEVGATIALDFPFFALWGIPGLALAHTLGYVIGAVVAGWVLARRIGGMGGRRTGVELAKTSAAGLLCFAAMWAVLSAAPAAAPWLQLVAGGTAGAVVFFGAAAALRVEDLSVYRRLVRRP